MAMLKSAAPAVRGKPGRGPAADKAAAANADGQITADMVMAKLHLQPQQRAQLERIVLAGMKVMFDAKTHAMAMDALQGPGLLSDRLGKAVAGLLGLLMRESSNSLPPNLLIPAGMVLVVKAAEFLRQTGQDVTDQDIGQAIGTMTTVLLQASGVDPARVDAYAARAQAAGGTA